VSLWTDDPGYYIEKGTYVNTFTTPPAHGPPLETVAKNYDDLSRCYFCENRATSMRNGIPQCDSCYERYQHKTPENDW
jgi:hypothetical protein